MKKLILVFTIIISFFVFHTAFKENSLQEYKRQSHLFANMKSNSNDEKLSLNFSFTAEEKNQFFDKLQSYITKNGTTAFIFYQTNITNFNTALDFYLYSKDADLINKLYTIKEDKIIDFSKDSKDYYTSDKNDKKSNFHINFLDSKFNGSYQTIITLRPFSSYRNSEHFKSIGNIDVYFYSKDAVAFKQEIMTSPLGKYIKLDGVTDEGIDDDVVVKEQASLQIIIVIALATFILAIGYIHHHKKEVILRKMYGMSPMYIMKKLFLLDTLIMLSAYFVTQVICFYFYVGNFYQNAIFFLKDLSKYFLFFFGCILLCACIIYYLLHKLKGIYNLKREKENRKLLLLNTTLKAIAIVILMRPMITQVNSAIGNTRLYTLLKSTENDVSKYVYFAGIQGSLEGLESKYMDYKKIVFDYFEKHGAYFQNFDTYYFSKAGNEEMYGTYPFPYLEANLKYLSNYVIKDENNKVIDINELAQDTILVPEKYRKENISSYEGYPIIYIQDGVTFSRNSVPTDPDTFYMKDPIIKVYTTIPVNHMMSDLYTTVMLPINNEDEMKDLEQYLKDNNLFKIVLVDKNENDVRTMIEITEDVLIQAWFIIIIQILAIIIFLFETIYLFIIQERNVFALRYLHGYSFIERYGDLFIANISIYIIALLSEIIMGISIVNILIFIIVLMLFETLCTYWLIKRFEKKKMIYALKGE